MQGIAGWRWAASVAAGAWLVSSAAAVNVPGPSRDQAEPTARLGSRLAWRTTLPIRAVDKATGYHLVDGVVYALATDGYVHAVRAETGQVIWSRPVVKPGGMIFPPSVYYSRDFYGIAFTLADEVVILDPETGSEYRRIKLESAAAAAATSSPESVFSAEANRFLRAYELKDNYKTWQIMTDGPLTVAPIYLHDLQTLFMADMSGTLAMVWASDKAVVYIRQVGGEPQGWVAMDHRNFYLATSDNAVSCIEKLNGATVWKYRLPTKPQGGPILVNGSIYQALAGGGVQRIGVERDRPNWLDENAVKFLAEWGGRAVLLHRGGRIVVVDAANGSPVGIVEAGPVVDAVANTVNSALLLTTPAGEIRCVQPADAPPAALQTFRPASTQPATQPSDPPLLARPLRLSEDAPLWVSTSGTRSDSSGATAGGGRRSERSMEGGSRRSSRGERGARGSSRGSSRESGRSSGRSGRGGREGGGRSGRSSRGGRSGGY